MEHKIELHDTIEITDKLENIKKDIDPVLSKIKNLIIIFIGIPFLLILLCHTPYLTGKPEFMNYERIMFASIGVLTFISIFYSLLISEHWREMIQKLKTYIDKKTDEITNIGISKIKESGDINVIQSEIDKVKKQIKLIDTFKQIFDVEYLLIITVFVLLFSIIFVIFDEESYKVFTYFFFSLGVSLSGAIVIIWRLLSKFSQELDSKKLLNKSLEMQIKGRSD